MKKYFLFFSLLMSIIVSQAQERSYARDMAKTIMTIWKDSLSSNGRPARWTYDQGVFLKGIENLWKATGDKKYFDYIQSSMDLFVDEKGGIRTYRYDEYQLDHITPGRQVLLLYNVTNKDKYLKAVQTLRKQLSEQPRTNEGGFWHKKIYPSQMWLDGLYMAEPFYTEYAQTFHEDTAFHDIAQQFILMQKNSIDPVTGLMYHGYDESRSQKWADKTTGRSPHFWARAMGWYGMGLVDVLENFPENHPDRKALVAILKKFASAVTKVQDKSTGLWWDIMDQPGKEKNYFESSASSMLVYTLEKAVRLGLISGNYRENAVLGYKGIIKQFIRDENGQTNLYGTVSVSGLGGNPYRDGSYEYYMSEKVVMNDPKGIGAFLLAATEMEMIPMLGTGAGKVVLLDEYFNNEWKKDANGINTRFHYTWEDRANSGFGMYGDIFRMHGAVTRSLPVAPTKANLKKASVYIIVDPDTQKETEKPNYINATDANVIAKWVKKGGVLLLMANDAGNADLSHTNILAEKFGVHFNEDNFNLVQGNQFEQGAVTVNASNEVFKEGLKFYIKELATLNLSGPAQAVLTKSGKNVLAIAHYGKGSVLIVGDPWVYNEYLDGRKLPADFNNYQAATSMADWALTHAKN